MQSSLKVAVGLVGTAEVGEMHRAQVNVQDLSKNCRLSGLSHALPMSPLTSRSALCFLGSIHGFDSSLKDLITKVNMSQFFMRSETKQTYDVIDGGSEKSSDEITSFLGHSQNTPRHKSIVKFVAPWIATTLFFAVLSIYLFISSRHSTRARGNFETGWNTDFGLSVLATMLLEL